MKRAKPGDIVRIGVNGNLHTYGQILVDPYVAVYDLLTADEITNMAEVVDRPVLFVVAVYHRALAEWPAVGKTPEGTTLPTVPEFFVQDMFNPKSCEITDAKGNRRHVEPQECVGLERAAVWEAGHIAERIRDYYAGRPNAHLEYLKLRL